jgi:hypothetical protein
MHGVRAGSLAAHALLVVACSGATTSIIEQPGDGGRSTTDGGAQGGVDATSGAGDAPFVGDDASEGGTVHEDAGHEAGGTCTPSPQSGGTCNSLTAPPPAITIQCNQAEPVPAPTGGTILDGTYIMTSAMYYAAGGGCPTPEVDGVTWLICGTSWQIAQTVTLSGQTPQTLVANATAIPSGSDLAITLTCTSPSQTIPPFTFAYDASGATLRLHTGGTASTGRVDTFTRQ